MVADTIPQLKKLSLAKKRKLIDELVDEVYGEPVTEPKLKAALLERVNHFRKNPDSARTWEEVNPGCGAKNDGGCHPIRCGTGLGRNLCAPGRG